MDSLVSSGAPSWQVDIPSITDLLLKLGASGLKNLQSSGVNIHTLHCLHRLGEVTPASLTFRKKLNHCRTQQRAEKWLLNSMLEIGSGTNHFVDQLLTTRSGENVLALLTSIVSFLDNSSTEILSTIFDTLGVAPDHTHLG